MKTTAISIFIIFILLSACKHEPPYYEISEETLAWVDFKPGSWWLYQDDSTGVRDCVWVKRNKLYHEARTNDGEILYTSEFLSVEFKQNSNNCKYGIGVERRDNNNAGNEIWIVEYDSIYYSEHQLFQIKPTGEFLSPNNLRFIGDTTIKGNDFQKIIHITSKYTDNDYYSDNQYWIAREKWIIKRIKVTPQGNSYWSLIDYNIVK